MTCIIKKICNSGFVDADSYLLIDPEPCNKEELGLVRAKRLKGAEQSGTHQLSLHSLTRVKVEVGLCRVYTLTKQ
jgi:hypothetical protein